MEAKSFQKPALGVDGHLDLLKKRGLVISNEEVVRHYLRFIGYYRLRGYFIPFQMKGDPNHTFLSEVTFELILDHYRFDRELRLLALDALERIEVALKTAISDVMSVKYGAHWYTEACYFCDNKQFKHVNFLTAISTELSKHKKTLFIDHYFKNYESPSFPASWMLFQILSFGFTSKLFKNLKTEYKKEIAKIFDFDHILLESWFESLTVTRNISAHHSRLYNLSFSRAPQIAKEHTPFLKKPGKFYAQAVIMFALLQKISKGSSWANTLGELLDKYPNVSSDWLGFPDNWKEEGFWGLGITTPSSPQ